MTKTLIKNATAINEGEVFETDMLIDNGRIEKILPSISADATTRVIDAEGKHLMPGMIDDQVHFREPGMTHKGNIHSESRAAVCGGITSFMDMPNTSPATLDSSALEAKYAIGRENSVANYAFYLGASNDNIEAIKALDPTKAAGIKVFMGASTGRMLVDDMGALEAIFEHAPCLIATHCEDTPRILDNTRAAIKAFGNQVPIAQHPVIRDAEACYLSSSLAVSLAKRFGSNLHMLHISTAREMDLFEPGKTLGKRITAEACVHFLHFDETDYAEKGNRIKCNPAIKSPADREGIIQGIIDGKIDIIATDHAPHLLSEKRQAFMQAPAGLPLVQRVLQVLFERYHEGRFSLPLIIDKVCHTPALRFDVVDRGFLREGYMADLVLIDLDEPETDSDEKSRYRCGWTPFDGYTFKSRVASTWVNGNLVYDGEQLYDTIPGQRLAFNR